MASVDKKKHSGIVYNFKSAKNNIKVSPQYNRRRRRSLATFSAFSTDQDDDYGDDMVRWKKFCNK